MYEVLLFVSGTNSENTPNWWRNFIDSSGLKFGSAEDVNEKLHPEQIHFVVHPPKQPKLDPYGDRYLIFRSEEEYVWFVLRWSNV